MKDGNSEDHDEKEKEERRQQKPQQQRFQHQQHDPHDVGSRCTFDSIFGPRSLIKISLGSIGRDGV